MGRGEVEGVEAGNARDLGRNESSVVFTNVAQLRSVPGEVFLGSCAFHLEGVVTLVDTNRHLLVLQDETGSVALNFKAGSGDFSAEAGQMVALTGSRCFPCMTGFPDYPYRPSGRDVRLDFEAPENWGDYHLTRMRGYLHPPATGEYTFWIASDNSSELWLSSNDDPTKVRKIASISRYNWVAPREWSHYPSQRSEAIFLRAGQSYYLEAFQEQTTVGDHVAVAWQGTSLGQSVIENRYLTPWLESRDQAAPGGTNGVLREYWTNFSAGGLAGLTGPKAFESILSVDELRVTARGVGAPPKPRSITLNEPLPTEDNYRWVEAQGRVTFAGRDGEVGFLELSDDEAQIQVRWLRCNPELVGRLHNAGVRVEGVCEGVHDQKGVLVPGLIWVSMENGVSLTESAKTNSVSMTTGQSSKLVLTNGNPAMIGFYATRGVVTFNDRVFGKDYMFVQEDTAAIFVSLKDRNFGNQFEVGRWVELGGALQPGKNIPVLSPLVVTELGWRSMPAPMTQVVQFPVPGNRDGRWTEAEGVVQSVKSNGTIALVGSGGPLLVWIGKTPADALNQYVDANLRVRGVLSLTLQDAPVLLVPSRSFVDVGREAPNDSFSGPTRSVANLFAIEAEAAMPHRVKLSGRVTYNGKRSFFMQDASGGVCVQPVEDREMQIGQGVEVVGFPTVHGSLRTMNEALVRPAGGIRELPPQQLNAGEGVSFEHAGVLIQITANLIAQRTKEGGQVLEVQERQRVFEAELPLEQMGLPSYAPGSRLQLSGVCDFATVATAASGSEAGESPSMGALKIRLRSAGDVVRLSGPPWWTWRRAAGLVGVLLTILMAALLRIHLLRRRLGRQLAFSRQILRSQEIERHRIAANLHDSLGQNLLVIINQARLARQPAREGSAVQQRLDAISDVAAQAIEEVRQITHDLRPYHLDRLGLAKAIRATVGSVSENSSILFASHVDDIDGLFDKESEIHVYRIVQEAVNNVVKHSEATEAAVVVKTRAAMVSLSIRDNGRGFEAGLASGSELRDVGYGLSGIKERVRILGGTLVVDSRKGQGTSLAIEIPITPLTHGTRSDTIDR